MSGGENTAEEGWERALYTAELYSGDACPREWASAPGLSEKGFEVFLCLLA